jgi:hypothetical protein
MSAIRRHRCRAESRADLRRRPWGLSAALLLALLALTTPGAAAVPIRVFQGKQLTKGLAVGTQATGVELEYACRCTLAKGKYTWRVYATYLAGNAQTSTDSKTLTVK